MWNLYDLMIKYDPLLTNSLLIQEYVLSDATAVNIHIVGCFNSIYIECELKYNACKKSIDYIFTTIDDTSLGVKNLLTQKIIDIGIDINDTTFPDFIDLVKVISGFGFSELYYYAEYYKKVYPIE